MKTDEIKELFLQFEAAASELEGVECWSARELQDLLGYSKWENFEKIANFLSTIDEKINRTENQIQKTQEWKKGLLQRMFV